MDADALGALLADVAAGRVAADDALARLRRLPFADLGYARVDHHRHVRQRLPEAVYGPGKHPEHAAGIVAELLAHGTGPVLLTRASAEQVKACLAVDPTGVVHGTTVVWRPMPPHRTERVVVAAAGTADLPVADECAAVLTAYGFTPVRLTDVGVAGLHRLLPHVDTLAAADAVVAVAGMEGALASVIGGITAAPVVAVAGMEGALASVIGGITAAPVVAVPTSVGYGAGLEGVTALLAMLSSCASGITVVGIDNGFGAACAIARLLGPGDRT